MSYSLPLRIAFLLLLVLAVALKVGSRGATEATPLDFGAGIGREMADHGFRVLASTDGILPLIEARAGLCNLVVGNMSPLGFSWDVFRRSAPPGSDVFVSYEGQRYAEQPRWLTTFGFYWTRLNRVVGRLITQAPVLGIATGSGCRQEQTAWLDRLRLI